MKRALLLTWEKFQDVELLYAYHRLQEECPVDVAANKTGYIVGINGVKIKANVLITNMGLLRENDSRTMTVNDYDLVVVVGGLLSVEKARQSPAFIQFLKDFAATGKVVASICHGAQYLISAKLTKGRRISGYYSIKDDIENSGATYVDEPYVIDGNIITSPHYDFQSAWMAQTIRLVHALTA